VIGKRVKMIKSDGWGKEGWTGVITESSDWGGNIRVKWDNGKSYMHNKRDILITDSDDPNSLFQLYKLKKKGFRL
jgi:hypothetical protein